MAKAWWRIAIVAVVLTSCGRFGFGSEDAKPLDTKAVDGTAGDAMTAPAVTIVPRRTLADAAGLMLELRIDRLPVIDGDQLVGIVTRTDLVRAFAGG